MMSDCKKVVSHKVCPPKLLIKINKPYVIGLSAGVSNSNPDAK